MTCQAKGPANPFGCNLMNAAPRWPFDDKVGSDVSIMNRYQATGAFVVPVEAASNNSKLPVSSITIQIFNGTFALRFWCLVTQLALASLKQEGCGFHSRSGTVLPGVYQASLQVNAN